MRALVISAFVLTLLVSALTVFFALRSSSMDGEPYVVIAIDPPDGEKSAQPVVNTAITEATEETTETESVAAKPSETKLPATESTGATPVIQYVMPTDQGAVERVTDIPEPEPASKDGSPRLTPASTDDDRTDATITNAAETSEASEESSDRAATRTTETAQPISSTDDPFFSSAEPGLGLGVGNLGPIDSVTTAN